MYIDGPDIVLFLFVWFSLLGFCVTEYIRSSKKLAKAKLIREDVDKRLALLEQREELVKKMNDESKIQMINAQKALIEAKTYAPSKNSNKPK